MRVRKLVCYLFIFMLMTPLAKTNIVFAQSTTAFDTQGAPSEQGRPTAISPQFIGKVTSNGLAIAWQLNVNGEGGKPFAANIVKFNRNGSNLVKAWEKPLPLPRLVGFTTDGRNYYAVSAANENKSQDMSPNEFRAGILKMSKFSAEGALLWEKDLNTTEYLGDKSAVAIYSPMIAGTGAVAYGSGKIAVALASNTEADLPIQSRHQRAQFFVVGSDGRGYGKASETSWRHSFDQRLEFDGQDFIFTDLGDAAWYMPAAGITVRKIRPTADGAIFVGENGNLQGTYIYARQGTEGNFSFTSLGDLVTGDQGYLALFTSEVNNPGIKRQDWIQPVLEPRNLGFVHVKKNFETVAEGSWNGNTIPGNTIIVNNSPSEIVISSNIVDSVGPSRRFQSPDKPEKSFTQTGIIWLTQLPSGTSAERPKLIKVDHDRFIAVWEEWSYSANGFNHKATKALVINEAGQKLAGPVDVNARLNPSGGDQIFAMDGSAAWITAQNGKINLHTLNANLGLTTKSLDNNDNPSTPKIFVEQLNAGDSLKVGDKLVSQNGRYTLIYQTDGNLVLVNTNNQRLWSSQTAGRSPGRVDMQTDGNLAMYGPEGGFQWNTGTVEPGSRFILQDNGNLQVVTPANQIIWSSNTGEALVRDIMRAGDTLRPGDKLQSANGRYSLVYQSDGNLVLYMDGNIPLWSTGTEGRSPGHADMQIDGNFAIYGADNGFQWNTGTTTPGSWLKLQDDANLVVYTASGEALWASNTQR